MSKVKSDAPQKKPASVVSKPRAKKSPDGLKTSKAKKSASATSAPQVEAPSFAKPETRLNAASPDILLKLWFDGWKKTFRLTGRSSRFELWSFLLINTVLMVIVELRCAYILSPRFLRNANLMGYSWDKIDTYITTAEIVFWLAILIPLFPLGSMLIRRMHDINRLAWQNCLEPAFMGMVVVSMLSIALTELSNTDYSYTALLLGVCFVTTLYSVMFYGLKFVIMTFFYKGNPSLNKYGPAAFNDDIHEELALNFSCLYFLFIATIGLLYLAIALI